jgi:hypothetical protein
MIKETFSPRSISVFRLSFAIVPETRIFPRFDVKEMRLGLMSNSAFQCS